MNVVEYAKAVSLTRSRARREAARAALLAAVALVAGVILRAAEPIPVAPGFTGPIPGGVLETSPRRETSGFAPSRRSPDILWTHDDSGGASVLYAVDTTGKRRGAVRLRGQKNDDWEDIASFEQDGTAWLLIADTGDNDARRSTVEVHLLEEPPPENLSPERELRLPPAYSLRIRFEDGPRDCESVTVDVAGKEIYLLTKRDSPPRLYRVPLGVARDKVVVAKFAGTVPNLGNTEMDALIKMVVGPRAAWPTAMDFAADGVTAVVLTYGGLHLFTRQPQQSWPEALNGIPSRMIFFGLAQAEAACFSADLRHLFVASEGAAEFIRYDRDGTGPK